MIYNYKNFILNENITQMRVFLHSRGLDKLENKLEFIKTKFAKKPNYISIFTKIMVDKDGKIDTEAKFNLVADWVINKNHLVSKLPKEIVKYETIEDLQNDINVINIQEEVDKYYLTLYSSMRNKIKHLNQYDKSEMDKSIAKFLELTEEFRTQFTPMKYFNENNISVIDFKAAIDNFTINGTVNSTRKGVMSVIAKTPGVSIEYDADNILVIQSNNADLILALGSGSWCIVYAQKTYMNTYLGSNNLNAQFICFNFNLPPSSSNSLYGITLDINNRPIHGGCQDRENEPTTIDNICNNLHISSDILTNPYNAKAKSIIKSPNPFTKILELEDIEGIESLVKIINTDYFSDGINDLLSKIPYEPITNQIDLFTNTNSGLGDLLSPLSNEFYIDNLDLLLPLLSLTYQGLSENNSEFIIEFIKSLNLDITGDLLEEFIPEDFYEYPDDFEKYGSLIEAFNINPGHDNTMFSYVAYENTTKDSEIRKIYYDNLKKDLDLDENGLSTYIISDYSDLDFMFDNGLDFLNDDDVYYDTNSSDNWSYTIDNLTISSVIKIYEYFTKNGIELEFNEVYHKYNTQEYKDLNYYESNVLYRDSENRVQTDIGTLLDYIKSVVNGEDENTQEIDDIDDVIYDLKSDLDIAYSDAYNSAMSSGLFSEFESELWDVFSAVEPNKVIVHENGKMTLKLDTLKLLEDIELAYLHHEYDVNFDAEDVLKYHFDNNNKLSIRERDYYSIDDNELNELITDHLG